ncbi:uncharacterized protein [Watersipora subatra]|uniref:uncharacterized protein n=1 Tax=Watersipora subatra TaxID=2589382 RepID=UPI00355B98FA
MDNDDSTSCIKDNHQDDDGEKTPGRLNFARSQSHPSLSRSSELQKLRVSASLMRLQHLNHSCCLNQKEKLRTANSVLPVAPKGYNPNIHAPVPPFHKPPQRPSDDEDSSQNEQNYEQLQTDSTMPHNEQGRYKDDAAIAPSMSSTRFLQTSHNNSDKIDEPQGQQSVKKKLSTQVHDTPKGDNEITNFKKH